MKNGSFGRRWSAFRVGGRRAAAADDPGAAARGGHAKARPGAVASGRVPRSSSSEVEGSGRGLY